MGLDGIEQEMGRADPGDGVHHHHLDAEQERHDEAGDIAHVVIERQPADDDVGGAEAEHRVVVGHMACQGGAAQPHRLAMAGGAG
jgi:predicted xylose isomerase-like sugar epimerase